LPHDDRAFTAHPLRPVVAAIPFAVRAV